MEEKKMKKEKQIKENIIVEEAFASFARDKNKADNLEFAPAMRLRSCNAYVSRIGKWLVLTSYSTDVAIIDCQTGVLYDFFKVSLWLYGYFSTAYFEIWS